MLKNITLSAEERLIEAAREKARGEHTTLNAQFRRWLEGYASGNERAAGYRVLMERLASTTEAGGPFSRDEMNER
ncbi:hypothetical protein [Endothiovibrio diazotrophicus]